MAAYEDDLFRGHYFRNNRNFLRLTGLWPFQSRIVKYVLFLVTFLTSEGILIPQVYALVKTARISKIKVLENVPSIVVDLTCCFKLVNAAYNNRKMKTLLIMMTEDWRTRFNDEQLEIMQKYATRTRKLVTVYACGILLASLLFVLLPILSLIQSGSAIKIGDNILPYQLDYYVDSKKYFYPILLHVILSICSHILTVVSIDCIFIVFIQHACGMFAVLTNKLTKIADPGGSSANLSSTPGEDKAYKRLSCCVRIHGRILEYVKHIEATYSLYFVFQLGLNVTMLTAAAVYAIMNAEVPQECIRFGAITSAQLIHLFLECWQAQELIDHSVNLHKSMCTIDWHRTSIPSRKLIVMMLMRSMIYCKLTAGEMITLSLESLSAVLRVSMSFFTVVRNMQ